MALTYGFNVKKAEELAEKLAAAYRSFGSNIQKEWEVVVNTLQAEWIGPDEQDFEKNFADTVCKMYAQSESLIKNAVDNIITLTNKWIEFQNNNTVSGDAIGTAKQLVAPPMPVLSGNIISYKVRTFSENDDMGLANSNSANKISKDVKDFANNLKKQSNNLFDAIQSNQAFFGDQSKKMDNYIEAVGQTLGEVTVAVKHLDDALATLAKSNYKTSDDNIESSLKTAKSDVEKLVDNLGETRWK